MRQAASSLKSVRHPVVGVIVDGVSSYGRAILRGVTRYANLQRRWFLRKDVRLLLEGHRGSVPKLDGVICAGISKKQLEEVRAHCKHVIFCSGAGDPNVCPVVRLDDKAAGGMAAKHLIGCRLTNFGFYGSKRNFPIENFRLTGFRQVIESHGYTCHEALFDLPTSNDLLTHAHRPRLHQWLKSLPKPIGIFAHDDFLAAEIADACVEIDLVVPETVAIIGVNNDDLQCDVSWPPLTSINPDYTRVGYAAAGLLDRLFAGEKLKVEERLVEFQPLAVVPRQSTSLLAVSDANLAMAVRYIREHACDPCSVSDVLRLVPVGRRWLERHFVEQFGRSPYEEITRVKIETAQRLLADPNLSIERIAEKCGFCDVKNFYVAFSKMVKITPAAYRKSVINSPG